MPTNEDRREIAGRLRRCSPTLDNALTFFRVFEAVYGTLPEDGTAMDMPRYLATLIDRERCENSNHLQHDQFVCSYCHVGFAGEDTNYFKYCPNCGAEVMPPLRVGGGR